MNYLVSLDVLFFNYKSLEIPARAVKIFAYPHDLRRRGRGVFMYAQLRGVNAWNLPAGKKIVQRCLPFILASIKLK